MVNSKRKGKRWERKAAKELNKFHADVWQRIPGSGALGTQLNISQLVGDLVGEYGFLDKPFRAEAKVGYGGATQITIKREWFEKIAQESNQGMVKHIPCLLAKFSGSRSNVRHFIAFTFEAWAEIMDEVEDLYNENIELRRKLEDERGFSE